MWVFRSLYIKTIRSQQKVKVSYIGWVLVLNLLKLDSNLKSLALEPHS